MKDFRSAVFDVCKKIQKSADFSVKELVHEIARSRIETKPDGTVITDPNDRSDFFYVAKHANNQFYGYLFSDENIGNYKSMFPQIKGFDAEERKIIENAHATITLFIDECCSDLHRQCPQMAQIVNPYSKYKPLKNCNGTSYLMASEYQDAVTAFKQSVVYKKVFENDVFNFFGRLKTEHIYQLFGILEKELILSPLDFTPDDIMEFQRRIAEDYKDVNDVSMGYSILLLSLREMLSVAAQLIFIALIGEDIIVLNNDNIISIDKAQQNSLYHYFTVLVQGVFIVPLTETIGDILLMDCDPWEHRHYHEFGFIRSLTASFAGEDGQTSKITFVTMDENLNTLHIIAKYVMSRELPKFIEGKTNTNTVLSPQKVKIYPNDPCPCGSGKKYKKCCGK